ncbi:MAG: YihY/virulence factor BrkB family protein [Pseudomonadota bacterium]
MIDILDGTVGDFVRHDGHIYAAAVAFYASVSFIPFLLLVISLGSYVVTWVWGGDETSAAYQDLIRFLRAAVPYLDTSLEAQLADLVDQRAHFGLAGAAALLTTSSLVFRSLEFALARVFSWRGAEDRKARPRNVVLSKLLFGGFVMAAVIMFVGGRYLLGTLRAMVGRVDSSLSGAVGLSFLRESTWMGELAWDLGVVLSFVMVLFFFTRSHTRPRGVHSVLGGVLFMLAWNAAGWAFDLYVGRFASLPLTYGPWATLILIQLWIFYSALVFMLSCEFVKTLERRQHARRACEV